LPGLLACRRAVGLSQRERADRAGIARETLARLERLRRRAHPETVEALARALGVAEERLTLAAVELPAILRPAHGAAASSKPPRER
jgi:transcriptional regulator with XRE-family HTH domain